MDGFRVVAAAVLVVGGISAGCAYRQQHLVEDAWFRRATREMFNAATQVPPADVHPVTDARRAEASRILEDVAAVPIQVGAAAELVGSRINADAEYVLVRGLCAGCGTGRFYVFANEKSLIVDHVGLAGRDTQAIRWPVVVKLPLVPPQVYVQYGAIQ